MLAHRLRSLAALVIPEVAKCELAEFWAHNRPHSSGHQLHIDSAAEGAGAKPIHPIATAVWFVSCGDEHDEVANSHDAMDLSEIAKTKRTIDTDASITTYARPSSSLVTGNPQDHEDSVTGTAAGRRERDSLPPSKKRKLRRSQSLRGAESVSPRPSSASIPIRAKTPPPVGGGTVLTAFRAPTARSLRNIPPLPGDAMRTASDGRTDIEEGEKASGSPQISTRKRSATRNSQLPAARCDLVPPRANRVIVFEGGFLHGVMPGAGASPNVGARRVTAMVAFWPLSAARTVARGCKAAAPRSTSKGPDTCAPAIDLRGGMKWPVVDPLPPWREAFSFSEDEISFLSSGAKDLSEVANSGSVLLGQFAPIDSLWADVAKKKNERLGISVSTLGELPSYSKCFQI